MKLKNNEVLMKTSNYQIQSESKVSVRIKVHEIIAGSDAKFVAVPVDGLGIASKNHDLHIQGNSEAEALEFLLEKVYELSNEEIYPKD